MAVKSLQGVVVTSQGMNEEQILFDDESGLILERGELGIPENDIDFLYDHSHLVFAGMGDIHIHAREDVSEKNCYKEDFVTASEAAINGGVTFAADMPNNPTPPIDDQSYKDKLALTEKSKIPLLLYAGIGPQTSPLSLHVPYKAYMGPSVGDLFFKNDQQMDQVLGSYRGKWVSFHCEDPVVLEENSDKESHYLRRPKRAEILATDTAISLIKKYQLKGKLCHFSTKDGLEKIAQAKSEGVEVTCEVTPQHLFFCLEELDERQKHMLQMNPPIRNREDRERLFAGINEGVVDYLATDHAPHTMEEKENGISGLTGLDTFAAIVTWLIKEANIAPTKVAEIACENPGKFYGQFSSTYHQIFSQDVSIPLLEEFYQKAAKSENFFGHLDEGCRAAFTILDMERPTTITESDLKTKCGHSPFLGYTFPGRLKELFLDGKLVQF